MKSPEDLTEANVLCMLILVVGKLGDATGQSGKVAIGGTVDGRPYRMAMEAFGKVQVEGAL